MLLDQSDADRLRQGASQSAFGRVGQILDAPACQVAFFGQFEHNETTVDEAKRVLTVIGQRHHVLGAAMLHRGQGIHHPQHSIADVYKRQVSPKSKVDTAFWSTSR